ncbi:uncharacterized protein si:zfos-911d5.4 [Salvelinus fontinalis]|uniref:uncharacterized protein si:zfos-911d5.4 n=1 Tax=Salvelinus fontinalis TaxID=8038 RepID=UPI0024850BB3|nr:uncharacterized protein si:zfos-911d5.4 [Salvelinus fontinalis]XP_055757673.1 uncharacterized protein si:zfos-911d5.4 [Salvelinus fontinalis]
MFQLGSQLAQFHFSTGPSTATAGAKGQPDPPTQPTLTVQDFIQHVRKLGGLKKEYIFCDLRVPTQFQTTKADDINLVILTGHGVFCIDVKPWRGTVSSQQQNWHVQLKEQDHNFTNTSIEQVADPLEAIMTKTANLWQYLRRSGVSVRQELFLPRLVFLAPDCQLDEELRKRRELVSHSQIDAFLRSFREGYAAWISDALTPAWLSGHLSYGQIGELKRVVRRMGTWDLVRLQGGEQLKGDFRSCPYIALNRQETDTMEFYKIKTLSANSLWALLGHAPQVTVKMYKRGAPGWLGKPLTSTSTIPHNTHVIFRINGEETDARIPANTIQSITLSI